MNILKEYFTWLWNKAPYVIILWSVMCGIIFNVIITQFIIPEVNPKEVIEMGVNVPIQFAPIDNDSIIKVIYTVPNNDSVTKRIISKYKNTNDNILWKGKLPEIVISKN